MEVSATTINSGDMAGVTLAAIKELSTENEALKEQVSGQQAAISGQQAQIEQQQKLIETQQRQIESMKKFICLTNKDADFCKE